MVVGFENGKVAYKSEYLLYDQLTFAGTIADLKLFNGSARRPPDEEVFWLSLKLKEVNNKSFTITRDDAFKFGLAERVPVPPELSKSHPQGDMIRPKNVLGRKVTLTCERKRSDDREYPVRALKFN